MPRTYVLDTTVFAHLTKHGLYTSAYQRVLDDQLVAVSFQTHAELLSANYEPVRSARLSRLLQDASYLPHSELTSLWYASVANERRTRRRRRVLGSDAGDGDIWIIAGALEAGGILLSHDRQQIALGRAAGLAVHTELPELRNANPT